MDDCSLFFHAKEASESLIVPLKPDRFERGRQRSIEQQHERRLLLFYYLYYNYNQNSTTRNKFCFGQPNHYKYITVTATKQHRVMVFKQPLEAVLDQRLSALRRGANLLSEATFKKKNKRGQVGQNRRLVWIV